MFEAGKKYKAYNGNTYECIHTIKEGLFGWLVGTVGHSVYQWDSGWKEVREPRTVTEYVNVYETKEGLSFGVNIFETEEGARAEAYDDDEYDHPRNGSKYLNTIPITYTEPH